MRTHTRLSPLARKNQTLFRLKPAQSACGGLNGQTVSYTLLDLVTAI